MADKHKHDQGHAHHHDHSLGNIKVAFFLNLSFTLIELVGGVLTNSVTILSDALHDLGDTLSLGLSWYFEKVARKKRDTSFTYGYGRFSLLAAIINAIVLLVGSVVIMFEAIPRLLSPEMPHVEGMFVLAILGVLFNGAAVLRIRKGKTMNEKVMSWHLLEDVLGWVAVLLLSVIMYFVELPILDPIFSVLFTGYILFNVLKNLWQTLKIFLQAKPRQFDGAAFETWATAQAGVREVHDLHAWSMDGDFNVVSLHLVVTDESSQEQCQALKAAVRQKLKTLEMDHATIEVEYETERCEQVDCGPSPVSAEP